jgi:hypothetical protein
MLVWKRRERRNTTEREGARCMKTRRKISRITTTRSIKDEEEFEEDEAISSKSRGLVMEYIDIHR